MTATADGPILVTGAGGFLGGTVVRALVAAGRPVIATGRRPGEVAGQAIAVCDLTDAAAVATLINRHRPAAIAHCAALIQGTPADLLAANVTATTHLARAAIDAGRGRLVFCSSISVYAGDGPFDEASPTEPADAYGQGKLAAEWALRAVSTALPTVALRLAGIHGPGRRGGIIHAFCARALAGQPLAVAEPETIQRPVFVDDAATAVIAALDCPLAAPFTVYGIAGAEALSLAALARTVVSVAGPAPITEAAQAPRRNRDLAIEAARRDLGYAPRPTAERLAEVVAALRAEAP